MRTLPFTLAAAAVAASSVHADVITNYWHATSSFEYRLTHMTDLDQRRNGLANTGNNHCVPTSTINLFCYAANHGFPFVAPGMGNWQSNTMYDAATTAISQMGALMGTSGTSGTNGSGASAGLNLWAGSTGILNSVRKAKTSNYTPTVAKMAKLASQGWLMSFAYGRYEVTSTVAGIPVISRKGGHAVTLVWTRRTASQYFLRYRDPSNDSSLSTQAPFQAKEVFPIAYTAYFGSFSVYNLRTMNAIAYPSSDGLVRIVDSYWGIRPKWGMRFVNTSSVQGGSGGVLELVDPTPLHGSTNVTLPQINISNFTSVLDVALHPDLTDALVLTRSIFVGQPSLLRRLDLVDGTFTTLPNAPENLAKIVPSREGFVYGFNADGKLYCMDAEDGSITYAISGVPIPSAIAFDDVTDTLYLLSLPERRVASYSKTLEPLQSISVPTSVPMSGDSMVKVDPTTGRAWFKTDASSLLYNVVLGVTGAPTVSTLTPTAISGGVNSFQFGDLGELYLIGNGGTKVMKKTSPTAWISDPTSPFHDLPGGQLLVLCNNSSNNDPEIHDTPGWHSLPTTDLIDIGIEYADCDADLDGNSVVNGSDLGLLLAQWGTYGTADLNQDGVVNGADLGMLLAAWGNCP